MSMGGGPDPLETIVNGAPASDAQIQALEQTALNKLDNMPVFLQLETGYRTEDGTVLMFRTYHDEEDEPDTVSAAVTVNHICGIEEEEFGLTFDPEGTLVDFSFYGIEDEDEMFDGYLRDALAMAEDAVENAQLDSDAHLVVSFLKSALGSVIAGRGPKLVGQQKPKIADAIKEVVKNNPSCEIINREFEARTGYSSKVEILGQVAIGEVIDEESTGGMPFLRIRYENWENHEGYSYVRSMDGSIELYEYDTRYEEADEIRELQDEPDDLDVEIRMFTGAGTDAETELGLEDGQADLFTKLLRPSSKSIQLLINQVSKAILLDRQAGNSTVSPEGQARFNFKNANGGQI